MKKLKLKRSVVKFLVFVPLSIVVVWYLITFNVRSHNLKQVKNNYETELINHGYTSEEANDLIEIFDEDKLDLILVYEVNSDILNFAKEKYFIFNNLERYLNYLNSHEDLDYKSIVALVNVNQDYKNYNYDLESDSSLKNKILVNKYYKLKEDYIPKNLVDVNNEYTDSNIKLVKEAYIAFDNLWNDCQAQGYNLKIIAGYQNYKEQEELFNEGLNTYGEKVLNMIAKPGYSDAQTGLSVKLAVEDQEQLEFKDTPVYNWLQDNAYLYGFIERYPENKENITGFSYDASYFRYVGKKIAKAIYKEKITYDEYYAYYIEKK